MRFWITVLTLLLLYLMSFRRGGAPEKAVSTIFVGAFIASLIRHLIFGNVTFLRLDPMLFAIEGCVMLALTLVAFRANRVWPLMVSALQLIILVAHTAKALELPGPAGVYWGMTTLPTYLQWSVLACGLAIHQHRLNVRGPYADWATRARAASVSGQRKHDGLRGGGG